MEDLLSARLQMAISLGFHIIFACIGMVMPFLMAFSHWKWLQTNKDEYLHLTKTWSKGVAIFFATGAVSGTVLSFELGLLWPGFMEHAGPIFGMPFSWEGTAFFIEAIALGLFLYGWNKINKWVHWATGVVVGISGVASGIFVVAANAWMNSPSGFDWVNGQAINIDPVAAMFNDAWFSQALHMTLAAFVSTSFAVAGIHAFLLLKHPGHSLHQRAMKIALTFGAITALLQPLSGDISAKDVAVRQPAKLAAMEALFKTSKPADLVIGGLPNVEQQRVDYAIHLPRFLSFLAHGDFNAEVKGLDSIPRDEWPPVVVVHVAFQIMVAAGMAMALIGLVFLFFAWKKKHLLFHKTFLTIVALATPLGFIAVEAGWTVTEVGRQPWILYGIMRTSDAVSPMSGLMYPMITFTILYLILAFLVTWLMARQIKVLHETYKPELQEA
ncbi:cytochrome ubiquinol oxidase subunit I [Rhodocytophaga aerolata]|uniref:Cytochrome ubiquinol oxidase subunit I n=1 Tax=Rhodocytophaga aerolata TaxID=455078 RepID=A0ABT8R7G0_9BACT|nr:cytochrome ubiquinol oxidase subunit I [Rhodocytophaga aerolata]MDO1447118.1 cytochrome ubiquinol oxidase subunit I [Rhodocytophaga aerolata]